MSKLPGKSLGRSVSMQCEMALRARRSANKASGGQFCIMNFRDAGMMSQANTWSGRRSRPIASRSEATISRSANTGASAPAQSVPNRKLLDAPPPSAKAVRRWSLSTLHISEAHGVVGNRCPGLLPPPLLLAPMLPATARPLVAEPPRPLRLLPALLWRPSEATPLSASRWKPRPRPPPRGRPRPLPRPRPLVPPAEEGSSLSALLPRGVPPVAMCCSASPLCRCRSRTGGGDGDGGDGGRGGCIGTTAEPLAAEVLVAVPLAAIAPAMGALNLAILASGGGNATAEGAAAAFGGRPLRTW
mmetsp:Transcript_110126/g.350890  ORF Transcript_110126/g.350890 Transcript_110126/m.350890 type:complete len:301 (-) Transcript_110126:251-1153(-)